MGDLRANSPEPNGVVSSIGEYYCRTAEVATEGIINQVRPNVASEERRKAVIDYVQRLIRSRVGCEVFPFGSVPLKTYLPDGDIDLTAVGGAIVEDVIANKVCFVLEREDKNDAQFVVKDVQLIRAEVKLVKCLVQNIVVDISFNQQGGLSTLCFLEKVDHLIGKEHLFKRSIILIKAWCYYESRILGAHHGLISTYALETLVLYIFHVFNSSLNGPLAVLYKFLDYFSKFDWDNYCISWNGPVRISSLPEFVVETIANGASDQLLRNDFLKTCVDMFSVPIRGLDTNSKTFPPKHLNIVDPLKENNNLGRSVSKGNFFRIRSAFTYGARKLGRILSQPEESVADELRKFFANTLDMHGGGQRPDVHGHIPVDGQSVFGAALRFQGMEYPQEDSNSDLESADSDGIVKDCKLDDKQYIYDGANAIVSKRQMSSSETVNEATNSSNEIAITETRLSGDAKDLATAKIQGLSVSRNAHRSSTSNAKETSSPRGKAAHAPHLHFSGLSLRNGEIRNGNPEMKHREGPVSLNEDSIGLVNQDYSQLISNHEVMAPVVSSNHPLLSNSFAWPSEDHYTGHSCSHALARPAESPDCTMSLADLRGDNESHLLNLYNSQCCYENTHLSSMSPPLHPQLRRNAFHWMKVNGAISGPYFPANGPLVGFGMEEMPKTRGTGTYFPNMNLQNHYRDRNYGLRGRNQGQMRSPRINGRISTSQERTSPEKNSHDASQAQYQGHQIGWKSGSSDHRHFGSAESKPYYNVNGSVTFPEKVAEYGSVARLPSQVSPLVETSRHPVSPGPVHDSSISVPPAGIQKPKPLSIMDQDSMSLKSYRLKDDGDFPPLSDSSGKGSPVSMVKKVEKAEE